MFTCTMSQYLISIFVKFEVRTNLLTFLFSILSKLVNVEDGFP